jgi:hypothetical protein
MLSRQCSIYGLAAVVFAIAMSAVTPPAWAEEEGCGDLSGTEWSELHDNTGQPPMVLTKAVPHQPVEAKYQTTDSPSVPADAFIYKGEYDGTNLSLSAPSYTNDGKPSGVMSWNLTVSSDCLKLTSSSNRDRAGDPLTFFRRQMSLREAVYRILQWEINAHSIIPTVYNDEKDLWDRIIAASRDPSLAPQLAGILYDDLADPHVAPGVFWLMTSTRSGIPNRPDVRDNLVTFCPKNDKTCMLLLRYWRAKQRWQDHEYELNARRFTLLLKLACIALEPMAEEVEAPFLLRPDAIEKAVGYLEKDKKTNPRIGAGQVKKMAETLNKAHVSDPGTKGIISLAIKTLADLYEANEKESDSKRLDGEVKTANDMPDQQQALKDMDDRTRTALIREQTLAVAFAEQVDDAQKTAGGRDTNAPQLTEAIRLYSNGAKEAVKKLPKAQIYEAILQQVPLLPELRVELQEATIQSGLLYYYSGWEVQGFGE